MSAIKKLENMAIMIIILFITVCVIAIGKKVKRKSESAIFQNNLKLDTTTDTKITIVVNGDTTKVSSNVSIDITGRRNDPQIKTEQEISFLNDQYECETYGWDHGKIVWSSNIYGDFEYIKSHSKTEKKKCDDFLYGKGAETSKNIRELQNK